MDLSRIRQRDTKAPTETPISSPKITPIKGSASIHRAEVNAPMGFGCLQLSESNLPDAARIAIIQQAYDGGAKFFDTAAIYGTNRDNEKLLGQALAGKDKSNITVATKCGIDESTFSFATSPQQIRASVEESLRNLGVAQIDLLFLHRTDPNGSPDKFDESITTMKQLVIEGKVKKIGLSEVSESQIRQAHALYPRNIGISSVESAYSIGSRRAELNGVLDACNELGIQFVAYTPLVRGLTDRRLQKITGEEFQTLSDHEFQTRIFEIMEIPANTDSGMERRTVGFFHASHIKKNVKMVLEFQKMAAKLACTPSQLALAWLQYRGITPIPGTANAAHLAENLAAQSIILTDNVMQELDNLFPPGSFEGNPNSTMLDQFDNPALEEKKVSQFV